MYFDIVGAGRSGSLTDWRWLLVFVFVSLCSCVSVFVNWLVSKLVVGAGRSGLSALVTTGCICLFVFVYLCIFVFVNLLLSKIIVGAGRSGSSTGRRWPLLVVEWSRQWSEAPPVAGGSPPSAQWSKVLQVHISDDPTNLNT